MQDEQIYFADEAHLQSLIYSQLPAKERPWKKDPEYFKQVKISAVALIKMAMHARSGGDIEIMGSL